MIAPTFVTAFAPGQSVRHLLKPALDVHQPLRRGSDSDDQPVQLNQHAISSRLKMSALFDGRGEL